MRSGLSLCRNTQVSASVHFQKPLVRKLATTVTPSPESANRSAGSMVSSCQLFASVHRQRPAPAKLATTVEQSAETTIRPGLESVKPIQPMPVVVHRLRP